MVATAQDRAAPTDEQVVRGHESAELAATEIICAICQEDFQRFNQARALFECEDIRRGGPNRYAHALHFTEYRGPNGNFTVFELPSRLVAATARAVPVKTPKLEFIDAATFSDKVPQQEYRVMDVSIESRDGVSYRSRVVVVRFNARWYAVPRCLNSNRIYELADQEFASNL